MAMSVTYNYTNIVEVMVALQWYYSALGTHTAAAAINQQLQELRDGNWLVIISVCVSRGFIIY